MARNVAALQGVLDTLKVGKGVEQLVWAALEPIPGVRANGAYEPSRQDPKIVEAYENRPLVECASAGCVAGTACMQAGDLISTHQLTNVYAGINGAKGLEGHYMVMNVHPVEDTSKVVPVELRGEELLGLSHDMAEVLFNGDNQTANLIPALEMLIAGESDWTVMEYLAMYNDEINLRDYEEYDEY